MLREAYEHAGGKDELWANAVASQHARKYALASTSLDMTLTIQAPSLLINVQYCAHTNACRVIGRQCMSAIAP